jgi:DNA-binding transcriptional LysR family regulator
MANHGYGITLLPEMALDLTKFRDNIKVYKFTEPVPKRKVGLCWLGKSLNNRNITPIRLYLKQLLK